jgi:hypothetical protein
MTTTARSVKRETLSTVRERGKLRPIIVELASTYAKLRLKGCRYTLTITYSQMMRLGAARRPQPEFFKVLHILQTATCRALRVSPPMVDNF